MSTPTMSKANWTIRTRSGEQMEGLTEQQVRDLLFRRQIQGEDWIAQGNEELRQIAATDQFAQVASPPRRRARRRQESDATMDMTPMIDVVFLLLIFFMITATFHMQTGLDFPPAQQEADESPTDSNAPGLSEVDDRIILEINEKDEFFIKRGGNPEPVNISDLVEVIRKEGESSGLDKVFVVAHEMASLESIVKAFDASAEVGISDVALADVVTPTSVVPGTPVEINRD